MHVYSPTHTRSKPATVARIASISCITLRTYWCILFSKLFTLVCILNKSHAMNAIEMQAKTKPPPTASTETMLVLSVNVLVLSVDMRTV